RIARMPDLALIDEKGIDEHHAARADPFEHRRKQLPIEKVDAQHVVERSGVEARTIEIDLHEVDGSVPLADMPERGPRDVDRHHFVSPRGEEQRVSAGTGGEIERASRPEELDMVDEKRGGLGVRARPTL